MFNLILSLIIPAMAVGCLNVCYPEVGCLDNCTPFHNFPLPDSPEDIKIKFYLYSREDHDIVDRYSINKSMVFSVSRPHTIFVIHGMTESAEKSWILRIKDELLIKEDANVILVDWHHGAMPKLLHPFTPASNTRVVGKLTSNLIQAIAGLSLASVHCIGFSLGAHACGFLGKDLNGTIGRISGLDPAGMLFTQCDFKYHGKCCPDELCRLSQGDAQFVDVIHTNAFRKISSGIRHDVGKVDFWVKYGRKQPECGLDLGGICSHERSHDLFIESINSNCKVTTLCCDSGLSVEKGQCQSCDANQQMGYDSINYSGRGTFAIEMNQGHISC